ncbi:FecR family protein [Sinomicrobium weinanense]|uniref:FecR domain-containing protein n=1 Tax=Sinomicrobium weinanense TaxID=2842200 RepID=A0A926Q2P1_9FLAO|nr:FecR domain-containing protein [Sinomicrobium weinanense]MBC9796837.1 FecR domain-containing protein [Sinomicrobium weinanense]MBU3125210.1 FecR domain-containing protein [Sinomicrobium weinanense]
MKKQEFIKLAEKYADGHCTPEEEQVVEAFFNKLQERELGWEWNEVEKRRLRMLYKIRKGIAAGESKPKEDHSLPWYRIAGIAASAALLVGTVLFCYFNFGNEKYTEEIAMRGERREITLKDGSTVYLNAESSLRFPEHFSDTREVVLRGEAFFEVARDPDRPFVVKTGKLETRVLGTSFNINAYSEGEVRVSVNTGKVRVADTRPSGGKVVLTKNEQVRYREDSGEFVVSGTDSDKYNAWTDDIIIMEDDTLREVADVLEKWFDVEITFASEALEKKTITGKYTGSSLRDILESIKFLKQVDYRFVDQGKIEITEMSNKQKPKPM